MKKIDFLLKKASLFERMACSEKISKFSQENSIYREINFYQNLLQEIGQHNKNYPYDIKYDLRSNKTFEVGNETAENNIINYIETKINNLQNKLSKSVNVQGLPGIAKYYDIVAKGKALLNKALSEPFINPQEIKILINKYNSSIFNLKQKLDQFYLEFPKDKLNLPKYREALTLSKKIDNLLNSINIMQERMSTNKKKHLIRETPF